MNRPKAQVVLAAFVLLWLVCAPAREAAGQGTSWQDGVGFEQKLNAKLPLELRFRDERGKSVRLGDYFGEKPVILTPVYYKCPMLCGLELNGLLRCLRAMELTAGKDFQIVTFSIDPREDADLAGRKRKQYLTQYDRDAAESGWHFLTGEEKPIRELCDAIGFRSKFNPETGQYAHAAGIVVCTTDGHVARYFYGVEFAPRDVRLGLVEASRNEIGTLTDQVLLFCYLYDPTRGKYGLAILKLLRAGGVLTVLMLAGGVYWMLRRERRKNRSNRGPANPTDNEQLATPD
jgi:protein SCO1/2